VAGAEAAGNVAKKKNVKPPRTCGSGDETPKHPQQQQTTVKQKTKTKNKKKNFIWAGAGA